MDAPFVCGACAQTIETFAAGTCSYCDENYQGALLPLCGCGDPDLVMGVYRDVLRDCASDTWPRPFKAMEAWPDAARLITMYALDSAGLLEHGGNVMGSWLTSRGKLALSVVEAATDPDRPQPA